ncbi:MAG: FkbM family methyltransferase, partial [Burkholderiales bacterium]|nr:FkbM family methyltransferase [Burkholderiales bacterium]
MISYAQDFEDVLLNRVFRSKPQGFYIDVGACDPSALSVTKFFYDLGWHGINIEPVPEAWKRFQEARPRDINLNVAAGARRGRRVFHQSAQIAFSSFDAQLAAAAPGLQAAKEYEVEVRTLAEICAEHKVSEIDFLKIDVEGAEQEVLEGADLTRWRPRVLVIEESPPHHSANGPAQPWQHWEPAVLQAGYALALATGLNRFYLRREDESLRSCFGYPPAIENDIRIAENLCSEFDPIAPGYRIQVRELRNARDSMQAAMTKEQERNTQFQAEIEKLSGQNARRKAEIEKLNGQNARLQAEIEVLNAQNARRQAEIERLNAQNARRQAAEKELLAAKKALEQHAALLNQSLSEARRQHTGAKNELQESWRVRSEQRRMYQALAHELRQQQHHLTVLRAVHREMLYRSMRRPPLWKRLLGLAPSRALALAELKMLEATDFGPVPEMPAPQPAAAPQQAPAAPRPQAAPAPQAAMRQIHERLELVEPPPARAASVHGAWRALAGAIASMPKSFEHPAVRLHPVLDIEYSRPLQPSALVPDLPWVGILHTPPRLPDWMTLDVDRFPAVLQNPRWREMKPACKTLITLSEYHRMVLKDQTQVPVHSVPHPLQTDKPLWSFERFQANPRPALVQVGSQYRCLHAIFMLPRSAYAKVLVHELTPETFAERLAQEHKPLHRQLLPGMLETAEVRTLPDPKAYEELITSNLLFLHLCDAGADAVLLECIERQVPLLVNRAPAVWEYLGPQYPLYYSFYAEAVEKAADLALVRAAHEYLGKVRSEERFSAPAFHKRLAEILAGLPSE